MASYKEIFGTNIEVLASDPPNPVEGQVWYNSTDNVVKGFKITATGSWATTNSINTARNGAGGAGVTSAAALLFGGYDGTSPGLSTDTESYNGTNWTEVNNLNTGRDAGCQMGAGTATSALYVGMAPPSSPG